MIKKYITTIVNVDTLLGYAIAFRFLKSKRKYTIIRLVCHETDGLEELENLGDVANATYNLCFTDNYSKNDISIIFTTQHTVTAKDVVSAANEGLDRDMTYDRVDPKALAAYLKKIHGDNRFRRRPFEQLGLLERDRPYTFPLGKYLTDNHIETILEWWHLADSGYTDVISYDLGRALGHSPQTTDLFFKQNSDQFRLLR